MQDKKDLERLLKYQTLIKNRLDDKNVPEKHKDSEKQYRTFLEKEYKMVSKKVDSLKMNGTDKK